jgi:uncharacterized protein (DUF2141 family)
LFVGGLLLGLGSASLYPISLARADSPPAPGGEVKGAPNTDSGEIRFQFGELKTGGVVRCALYAAPQDYMKKSFREVVGSVSGGHAVCVFAHVTPGTYSMASFHDQNNNDKLDTGIFGIPTEGLGFSNNAKGTMGPPKYKDASFAFSGGSLVQDLKMKYR